MKIIFAVVALALMTSAVSLCNLLGKSNSNNSNSNTSSAAPTPTATPSKPSLKDAFPQQVGAFTLQDTYTKAELKGDDKFLPGAEEVMGAVYKTAANKKEQLMVGSYPSPKDAETARAKRVSTSKYIARWTKGNLLYISTDGSFKNKI
jgi:hypothetical protein